MATTIQNFFSKATSSQFSRDFLFRVKNIQLIGGVNFSNSPGSPDTDQLVYARTAALPGRNITNQTVNYFGQEFQVPGRATYANAAGYSIEFYHDETCDLRTQFEGASRIVWEGATGDERDSTGLYGMPGVESVIDLEQINKDLRPVRGIQLVGASIRDIGDISYSIAEGQGAVLNFPVTFAYHFYKDFSVGNVPFR
jgi:hypothetical protein